METAIKLNLNPNYKKRFNKIIKENHISQNEFINEAVEYYIPISEFNSLRNELKQYAEKMNFISDEDVFNDKEIS